MYDNVKYNRVSAVVFVDALDTIPLIRDGKGDVTALLSFASDIRMLKRFRQAYVFADAKLERIKLIDKWNYYIKLRNKEDFIPHNESENKGFYCEIF